jgi:hypothetical protein
VLAEDGGVEELAIRLGGSLHPPILLDLSRNRESCRIAQRSPRDGFIVRRISWYRYRYYTCSSRRRYGTAACSAERLPADQRESEGRGALLRTIRRHDQAALAAGLARSGAQRRQHQDELGVVDAELTKSEEAIDRYFLAFEAGTLSETTCGPP